MNPSTSQLSPTAHAFSQLFSSTRRGARLARLLAVLELHAWGCPQDASERAEWIVAELAANAVLHGRVRGRGFRLGLAFDPGTGTLRIEVTDARGERAPHLVDADADGEGGRGLLLVGAFADRWGSAAYPPGGKTVWAEVSAHGGPAGRAVRSPGPVRSSWRPGVVG
ncbi:ATP-binding protein [Streptomyces sp. TRM76323]|uniref:ATP-binding protein n=1 Tax=Streptomyces tamarix TaxID=3078565 RepID=A0ABU3QNB7_9ACTN|nr:ATP-binding protein [Streptomyces tamarix]MDT9684237.1 ATP-binding protein [Streptomyces tamarix]